MEEAPLGDVNADQLRHLVEHDDQPDASLEAGEHGRRYEIREKSEPEDRRSDQQHAGHAVSVAAATVSLTGSPSGPPIRAAHR